MCSSEHKVTLKARIDNLDNDVLVGETNDKAIFGCVAKSVFQKPKSQVQVSTHYLFFACDTNRLRA
jgi:hypothetical protein